MLRQWDCLTGSRRTDLSPLKINTTGRLPSGFCHRLHPLKSSPDPGGVPVSQPRPLSAICCSTSACRNAGCHLNFSLTRRLLSPLDMHGSASRDWQRPRLSPPPPLRPFFKLPDYSIIKPLLKKKKKKKDSSFILSPASQHWNYCFVIVQW